MIGRLTFTAALALATVAAAQTPPAPPPAPCAAPEHRQFDFWVGRWDVYATGKPQTLVAHSLIESLYDGCAIRENWMPIGRTGGGSLSSYVAADKAWRQTWVDASGARVDFRGGIVGPAMVLDGFWPGVLASGADATIRMTYTRGADGSVRQLGESTVDGGRTWQPSFDFIYRSARP